MSQYRRLISYIYAYEGGVRGKNTGFAKIEVRGDQCRIYINIKKIYVGSNDIGVYLLAPGAEILLGRIFIRGGAGEFRINVNCANIEGSGCTMEECYGLTIHDVESTWQCYTTIWEDAVTQAAETTLAEVTAERIQEAAEREKQADSCPTKISPLPEEKIQLPISEEIERELELEAMRLETQAPWDNEEDAEESSDLQPVQAEDPTQAPTQAPVPSPVLELEDAKKLQELDRMEQEEMTRNDLWDQLQRHYTKILAFDYDNGCEILSIKPQDIGLLPREIWVFGNNSFLLHGYYNYRHLILARLNNPKGNPRYLLGVPGHYFSNEKYMASMFGFPHFVLARKQPENDGRFGYWYTDIRL